MEIESTLRLLIDLRDEADLCRNETATDIADLLERAAQEIERLNQTELAAKNLCCVKGHHSEQAMRRLMAACGFEVPNEGFVSSGPTMEVSGMKTRSKATQAACPLDRSVGHRVLDPCCGTRMMWLDRKHPDAVFGDQRSETITVTDRSNGKADGVRILKIEPDTILDFRALPYQDGAFKHVVFDPPHLHTAGPRSWLAAKYGKLSENWRDDLRQGFAECFRVLDKDGTLVFKWSETQVKVGEVLALTPHKPMYGHISGRKGLTHWLVFMVPNVSLEGAEHGEAPARSDC